MTVSQGFLPYGSTDTSVLLQVPLTAALTAADVPYSTVTIVGSGTAPAHDAVNGMTANDQADHAGTDCSYKFTGPDGGISALDTQGQLSIEVEREWLCDNTLTDSTGYVPTDHEGLVSLTSTSGDASHTQHVLFEKRTLGQLRGTMTPAVNLSLSFHEFEAAGASQGGDTRIHSEGLPDFVTVNIGWWGGFVSGGICVMAVDGHVISYGSPVHANVAGVFDTFFLGSDHTSANEFVGSHYFRNLQVSSAKPVWDMSEELASIAFLSDSLLDAGNVTISDNNSANNTSQFAMQKWLTKYGKHTGEINVDENGGWGIGTYVTSQQLVDRLPTVQAFSPAPTALVISAGTNDFVNSSYSGTDFTAEYKDLLEQAFFGAAKDGRTPINHILISKMPPRYASSGNPVNDNATWAANQTDVLARVDALVSWWDATYPTWAGRVRVLDLWTLFGADNLQARNSVYPTHTIDDTHMGSKWNRLTGEAIARSLWSMSLAGAGARSSSLNIGI